MLQPMRTSYRCARRLGKPAARPLEASRLYQHPSTTPIRAYVPAIKDLRPLLKGARGVLVKLIYTLETLNPNRAQDLEVWRPKSRVLVFSGSNPEGPYTLLLWN